MRRKLLKADIARGLGVSRSRVAQLEAQGMPLHSLEAAKAWRDEHCDPDRVKRPPGEDAAAPADNELAALKKRLLTAEVQIRESKAENAGGVSLPSLVVEAAVRGGLQLVRASLEGSWGRVHDSIEREIGEEAARTAYGMVQRWHEGLYNVVVDALFMGFQHELPQWGRDFRHRWVVVHRGNFPDQPYRGEPREVPGNGEADGDA